MSVYQSRIAEHPGTVDDLIRVMLLRSYVFDQTVFAEQINVFIHRILSVAGYYRPYVVY